MKNQVVAIVGMCGSGKSVAVDYFIEIGYQKVYFGGVTFDYLEQEKLEKTKENEQKAQRILREKYGMGAYAILSISKIKENLEKGNVVIDGLYSWDELKILQESFPDMITIAIMADKSLRYFRLSKRPTRSYNEEEARTRDIFEIENTRKGGPIAYADYFAFNNGSKEDLNKRLEAIINESRVLKRN